MFMTTKQVSSKKIHAKNKQIKNLDSSYFHDYDTIARIERRMKEQMSSENMATVKKYDIDAITQSIDKAARIKHLSILLKFSTV